MFYQEILWKFLILYFYLYIAFGFENLLSAEDPILPHYPKCYTIPHIKTPHIGTTETESPKFI